MYNLNETQKCNWVWLLQLMNLVDSAAEACIHSFAATVLMKPTVLMETLDTGTEE